jgi:hypothetical protein
VPEGNAWRKSIPRASGIHESGRHDWLAAKRSFGRPGKSGPAIFALYLSEDRCFEASPKQLRDEKSKPPERNIGPGLTSCLAPSASAPVPSHRSSDLLRGARLPRNIGSNINPLLRPTLKTEHFYFAEIRTFLLCVDIQNGWLDRCQLM